MDYSRVIFMMEGTHFILWEVNIPLVPQVKEMNS